MKKELQSIWRAITLLIALSNGAAAFAQFSADKFYTIANHNAGNNNFFLQDINVNILKMGPENAYSLWRLEPTANEDCYYIKNVKTGKYVQTCKSNQVAVAMGDTPVEYHIKADASGSYAGWYRLASTDQATYNFTSGTIGLNRKDDTTVQGFASVAGANPWSGWYIREVTYTTPTGTLHSPFTGIAAQQADGVYLYNVESGMWLENNNRKQDNIAFQYWTTRAELGTSGIDFNLTADADAYIINPRFGGNHMLHGNNLYLDTNVDVFTWAFKPKSVDGVSNAYSIESNLNILGSDANDYLRGCDLGKTTWQIVTREERMKIVCANASAENPVDVSFLIGNPDLANNNERNAWAITRDGGADSWNDNIRYNRTFHASAFTSLNISQTDIAVPNGTYRVQFSAMYSPTLGGSLNSTDYSAFKANGEETVKLLCFANNEEVKARSIYSEEGESKVTTVCELEVDGKWFASGNNQVNGAMAIGKYLTAPLTVTVTDGKLSIGIKSADGGVDAGCWIGFGGVRLYCISLDDLTLSDTQDNAAAIGSLDGKNKNITIRRPFSANEWNTLLSPVDIDNVEDVFGVGAQVARFNNEDESAVLHFNTVTTIEAGVPYLVKPTSDITEINTTGSIHKAQENGIGLDYDFVGVYDATPVGNEDYFVATGNILQKNNNPEGRLKPFRAYFRNKGGSAKTLTAFDIDGETTGILDIDGDINTAKYAYSISGMPVALTSLPKGVYIVNNKKVIVR